MRKVLFLLIGCILICVGVGKCSGIELERIKKLAAGQLYEEVNRLFFPQIYLYDMSGEELLVQDVEKIWLPTIVSYSTSAAYENLTEQEEVGQDTQQIEESEKEGGNIAEEETAIAEPDEAVAIATENACNTESPSNTETVVETSAPIAMEKKVEINRTKLQDFDYLLQNFYQVDRTTTIGSDLLDVNKLLEKDMTLAEGTGAPQILIYHTHSQEGFADSVSGDASTSVVALGEYLEKLLEEDHGIQVLHHKGQYDLPSRDNAYSQALPHVEQILKDNPSIEVVIDLHRDGVPETTHLVTEVNGKPTAQIMFFNGLSRTTSTGELSYLANPYLETNLALSFQMQLTAAEYYPGLTRRIYLKGYRYNMHVCPKSMLVEVGAQTNTFAEAKNAMEPLADILSKVLKAG